MKTVFLLVGLAVLSGCAGLSEGMHRAAGDVNHGVARAPDARVDVNVK